MYLIEFERTDSGDTVVRILDWKSGDGPVRDMVIGEAHFRGEPPGLRIRNLEGYTLLRVEKLAEKKNAAVETTLKSAKTFQ